MEVWKVSERMYIRALFIESGGRDCGQRATHSSVKIKFGAGAGQWAVAAL